MLEDEGRRGRAEREACQVMDVALVAVVLAVVDLALVGLLAVSWSRSRAEDRRRMQSLRRELLDWLQETQKLEKGEVPSWMVEP